MSMLYCETLASLLIVASECNCHGRLRVFVRPGRRYFLVYLALCEHVNVYCRQSPVDGVGSFSASTAASVGVSTSDTWVDAAYMAHLRNCCGMWICAISEKRQKKQLRMLRKYPHLFAELALETERLMYKEGNGSGAALLGAIFRWLRHFLLSLRDADFVGVSYLLLFALFTNFPLLDR